jgi:hypothetical protein
MVAEISLKTQKNKKHSRPPSLNIKVPLWRVKMLKRGEDSREKE